MRVTHNNIPEEGIRIIASDLCAALKGEPPLESPDCMHELWRSRIHSQANPADESR
jgi:hypothetical protein